MAKGVAGMQLKAFDMFSGYGGFRLAGEMANIDFVGYCEMDKWAVKFYNQAFDTTGEVYFKDATKIDTRELPDFDILLAGFPCQAFSIAGKRQGFNDTRGTLFFDVARILKDKHPKYFVLENVKGLLNHDNGRTFATIIGVLTDIGYSVEWQVLNTKYFGLPQNRERVFIVGCLGKRCSGQIFPIEKTTGSNNKTVNLITNVNPSKKGQNGKVFSSDGLAPTLTINKGEGIKIGTLRTHNDGKGFRQIADDSCPCIPARAREDGSGQPIIAIPVIYDDYNQQISKDQNNIGTITQNIGNPAPRNGYKIIECINPRKDDGTQTYQQDRVYNSDGIVPAQTSQLGGRFNVAIPVLTPDRLEKRQNGRRFKENGEEMFTLTGQDKHGVFDGYKIRRLTPLECFRLQGFPDEVFYKGSQGLSDAQLYKGAGNSVSVNVVYEVAKRIKKVSEKLL